MAEHKLHIDQTFDAYPTAFLRRYRADLHEDVTDSKNHIYFVRHSQKWVLVRMRNGKYELSFYDLCPCNLI